MRQFHQLGVEVLGTADPRADVEVIAIATDILKTLGLTNLGLDLNSVGNKEEYYSISSNTFNTPGLCAFSKATSPSSKG